MKQLVWCLLIFSIVMIGFAGQSGKFPDSPKMRELGSLANKVDSRLVPALNSVIQKRQTTSSAVRQLKEELRDTTLPSSSPNTFIVQVDCENTTTVAATIRKIGANVLHSSPRWKTLTVEATLDQIRGMSTIPGVDFIRLESGAAVGTSGQADNHADVDMKANQLRNAYGLTGVGQKIGVLSDTCNRSPAVGPGVTSGTVPNAFLSGANDQLSGDLPASYQVVDFGPPSGNDEGAGMMELVHDICPASSLAFASAFLGQTSFADNIEKLRTTAGCTVICDDVFYTEEPFFQDGPIAQAIEDSVANGVPYFTLAGNHYNGGIQTVYRDIDDNHDNKNQPPTGEDFHDWGIAGATPSFLPVSIGNGTTLKVSFQWNQPWSSYGLGNGSEADLDIFLYDTATTSGVVLTRSSRPQGSIGNPNGNPSEYLSYKNTSGHTETYYLAIDHFGGVRDNVMRVIFLSNGAHYGFPGGGVNGPTIYGHMATANAVTVGAIFHRDIDTNGTYGPDYSAINAESFSSKGGRGANGIPIYFTTTGTLIADGPELRDKPDIAAPDGVNTRYFGSDSSADSDSFPNFFGTSAATPNAAAVGALLLEKRPSLTPAQLKHIIKNSATDIVASNPRSIVGPDDYTGSGLINGLAAATDVSSVDDWDLY